MTCNSSNLCQTCNSGYDLRGGPLCVCDAFTYDSGGSCSSCTDGCDTCNSTHCLICTTNYKLNNTIC